MGLDHSLVGVPSEPQVRSWDSKDALLYVYAVGVGAGLGDPLQELEFTTENCQGIEQNDGTVVIDRGRLRVREPAA